MGKWKQLAGVDPQPDTGDEDYGYEQWYSNQILKHKQLKMKKKEAIKAIESMPSSIMTKEDVIKLINSIDGGKSDTSFNYDEFFELLQSKLEDIDYSSFADNDSVQLSLSYDNQIEIESIEVDSDSLIDTFLGVVKDTFELMNESNTVNTNKA